MPPQKSDYEDPHAIGNEIGQLPVSSRHCLQDFNRPSNQKCDASRLQPAGPRPVQKNRGCDGRKRQGVGRLVCQPKASLGALEGAKHQK